MRALPRITMRAVAFLALLTLAACGVAPRAVVIDRAAPSRETPRPAPSGDSSRVHVVQRGDTLYSIAFRHGLEYRQVAAWNGIAAPFTIYPGQRLRLGPPGGAAPSQRPTQTAGTATGSSTGTRPVTGATPPSAPVQGSTPTPTPSTPSAPAGTTTAPVASAPTPPVSQPPAPTPAPTPTGAPRWQWPTAGQVVGRFVAGDPTRQGLSIAGSAGQPVLAAADGVIVYSGSGLIGYGELIIVKHNDEFLSAYGHNRKRLVAEGEQVRGGQQIAEMGRSGAARDMLHFEIRRNGRPVDPSGFLPAR